jgi:hypothetical protein
VGIVDEESSPVVSANLDAELPLSRPRLKDEPVLPSERDKDILGGEAAEDSQARAWREAAKLPDFVSRRFQPGHRRDPLRASMVARHIHDWARDELIDVGAQGDPSPSLRRVEGCALEQSFQLRRNMDFASLGIAQDERLSPKESAFFAAPSDLVVY